MSNKKTDLSELGEFGLIKHLTKNIEIKNPETIKGVGDDAAVLNYKNKQIVVTTDLLIEGIHFNLMYVPLKHLGYKAVVVNLSDVYAMNGIPKQITVSLAISNRFSLEAIEELYEGIKLACDNYKVDLIGGDTSASASGMIISISAIGEVEKEDITYRHTAKENDLICVSGDLGAAYAGLQLLERENEIYNKTPEIQPELKGYDYILERQLKPEARGDIIKILSDIKVKPTSMIDISDGLSSEILHICDASSVGCKIFEDKIPIAAETGSFAKEINIDSTVFAMNGGEDYELLFTVSQDDFEKIKSNEYITIIGHISGNKDEKHLIARDGTPVKLEAQGWNSILNNS